MAKKILVPVDGSGHISEAIKFAASIWGAEDVILHLIHVVRQLHIPEHIKDYVRVERIDKTPEVFLREKIGKKLLSLAEEEAQDWGFKKIETFVSGGDPAEEIIRYASHTDMDMIVLGSRGTSLGRSRVGSVAIQVVMGTDTTCVVVRRGLLEGRKVLIVDDEPDVLETLEEFLGMCDVKTASNFQDANEMLLSMPFDIAILDIMGVNGYELLKTAKERNVLPVILTAHAMSLEDTAKSYKEGAASFIPKEKMEDIASYLNDVLDAQMKGRNPWGRWFHRFGDFYKRKFGSDWKDQYDAMLK